MNRGIFRGLPGGSLAGQPGMWPLANYTASAAPTVNDDEAQGYAVGSFWLYSGVMWVCLSATRGAASWRALNQQRLLAYATGTINNGATFTVPDASLSRVGGGIVFDVGNTDIGTIQWYRSGTFNTVVGTKRASAFVYRGTTFSPASGANTVDFYLSGNSAGDTLNIKNNLGFGRDIVILDLSNLATLPSITNVGAWPTVG